jgi:hypothetical protein
MSSMDDMIDNSGSGSFIQTKVGCLVSLDFLFLP